MSFDNICNNEKKLKLSSGDKSMKKKKSNNEKKLKLPRQADYYSQFQSNNEKKLKLLRPLVRLIPYL
ncbi:hypothetical protein J5U21_01758 [Saccharolobus shibatae]|uniref:Uncharacterized protein n=1 Tax=Saccharolobus shibatae TaxID=2286 RepID=A0A8F5BV94_9CREN|nr:hypothetical protein J5U21_01758 [Saccharolobus shibatae]